MRVEAAAAVRPLSCVGLGLVLRAQLSQLRLGGGRGGGVFRLEKRADEWRQFSPFGPEGLMGSVGDVLANLGVGGGSQGAVVGGETAWNFVWGALRGRLATRLPAMMGSLLANGSFI